MQNCKTVWNLAEVKSFIQEIKRFGKVFSFDTETTSLEWRTADCITAQLSYEDDQGIVHAIMIPFQFEEVKESWFQLVAKGENPFKVVYQKIPGQLDILETFDLIAELIEDADATCGGSNLKYDYLILLKYRPHTVIRCQSRDTMLSAALMHKPSMGLKENVLLSFGYKMATFTETVGDAEKTRYIDPALLLPYATDDVVWGLKLAKLHEKELQALTSDPIHGKKLKIWKEVECPNVAYLTYMEFFGIRLDIPTVKSMDKEFQSMLHEIEEQFYEVAGCNADAVSMTSAKDLVQYFILTHKHWSTKDAVATDSSQQYKVDAQALEKFAESRHSSDVGSQCASLLSQHRKLSKLVTTYMSMPDLCDENGRLHTSFSQAFTTSYRLSSSNPNLQNIPVRSAEGRRLRQAFIAAPKHKLVVADLSNAELRITASITGDAKMLETFNNNLDLHEITAIGLGLITRELCEKVHNGTATKEELLLYKIARSELAKTFNFAAGYGASNGKLLVQLNAKKKKNEDKYTLKQVAAFKDAFWETYSGYAQWRKDFIKQVQSCGFARSPFGYTADYRKEIKEGAYYNNSALNFPIQNTAGGWIKLAQANILKRIMQENLFMVTKDTLQHLPASTQALALELLKGKTHIHLIKPLLQIHDELIMECIDDPYIVNICKEIVSHEMTHPAKLKVPLPAEAGCGYNWLEAK
jgi:DNA polymerase-1